MDSTRRYDSLFQFYADEYGLDWGLLWRQAQVESGFVADAFSRTGAMGLTQFMPETWYAIVERYQWKGADPLNPEHSIRAQAAFMSELRQQFGGNVRQALAAYNAGPGLVGRLITRLGDRWESGLPNETKNYLVSILGA